MRKQVFVRKERPLKDFLLEKLYPSLEMHLHVNGGGLRLWVDLKVLTYCGIRVGYYSENRIHHVQ